MPKPRVSRPSTAPAAPAAPPVDDLAVRRARAFARVLPLRLTSTPTADILASYLDEVLQ